MNVHTVDTFLTPIEHPRGLMMKLAYFFTRKQFGKVLTPLKVHSARLPAAFGLFYSKVAKLDKKLTLPTELVSATASACRHKGSSARSLRLARTRSLIWNPTSSSLSGRATVCPRIRVCHSANRVPRNSAPETTSRQKRKWMRLCNGRKMPVLSL